MYNTILNNSEQLDVKARNNNTVSTVLLTLSIIIVVSLLSTL